MKKLIAILPLLILFFSCEKAIDFKLPYDPPTLTIDTRIMAGDSISVIPSISNPALSNTGIKSDSTFKIFLFEDGNQVDELKPSSEGYFYNYGYNSNESSYWRYSSGYIPKSGHEYTLQCSHNGFNSISGKDRVPSPVGIQSYKMDTTDYETTLEFEFKDPAAEKNFYLIRIKLDENYSDTFGEYYYGSNYQYFSTFDPLIDFFYDGSDPFGSEDGSKSGNLGFLSDEAFNGKTKKVSLKFYSYYYGEGLNTNLSLELLSISEDYYKHERSKAGQFYSDGLFGEVTQIYTNITNGYGVVACASKTVLPLN